MTILQSLLLGIIQGLTEFLPISSSAHLVIFPYFLGWELPKEQTFVFFVLVQVATLLGVAAYYWKDVHVILGAVISGIRNKSALDEPKARLGWYLLLAALPAGVVGLSIHKTIEEAFANPPVAGVFLLCTSALLALAERFGKRSRHFEEIAWTDALWIGIFQAVAVFPGISRSGATIVGGMVRDFDRPSAARFSFLLSIPTILGAGLDACFGLLKMPAMPINSAINISSLLLVFIPGFLASGILGFLSIRWLIKYLTHRSLSGFAVYTGLLGLTVLLTYWWRR